MVRAKVCDSSPGENDFWGNRQAYIKFPDLDLVGPARQAQETKL